MILLRISQHLIWAPAVGASQDWCVLVLNIAGTASQNGCDYKHQISGKYCKWYSYRQQ